MKFNDAIQHAIDTITMLMNGIEWNIDAHPAVMNSSDDEALASAEGVLEDLRKIDPLDLLLFCPRCHTQHIDAPESISDYTRRLIESRWPEDGSVMPARWMNPPHATHQCECGCRWRPADVYTNGVASIQTRGTSDNWSVEEGANRYLVVIEEMSKTASLPRGVPESDHFLLEAAMQKGFEIVHDDGDVFSVRSCDLVSFAKLYRDWRPDNADAKVEVNAQHLPSDDSEGGLP